LLRISWLDHLHRIFYTLDETFFIRLEDSFKYQEDRQLHNKYNIFIDKDFNDRDYYKKFPTIYHLRKHLINSNQKEDIRLIYLALHHIIKYRGNFLYENQNFDISSIDLKDNLISVCKYLQDIIIEDNVNSIDFDNFNCVLFDNKLNRTQKKEKLKDILNNLFIDKKQLEEFVKLILGFDSKLNILFNLPELSKEGSIKINFSSDKYEENKEKLIDLLDDKFEAVEGIKKLYDGILLKTLFKGSNNTYLSELMVEKYQKHKDDLKKLKQIIRENYSKDDYNRLFKKSDVKNYYAYINSPSKCTYADLKKTIKSILDTKVIDSSDYRYIYAELDNDNFLLRINVVDNSIYPYQLNLIELEKIISNQSKFYPCLAETTSSGESKLVKLLKFRIPYYVGPLNLNSEKGKNESRSFAWIVKKKPDEKITPFNFDEVVDTEACAEKFITRMTNTCTYLRFENVIPKNSLLYSKYMVLNELKQIKINDRKISQDLQKRIYNELFMKYPRITEKKLKEWLLASNNVVSDDIKITGFQKDREFASSLKPYIDFKNIFMEINDQNYNMIEDIIKWITIFEDKNILAQKIKKSYPQITTEQINEIIKLDYTGWAALSKKLLTGLYYINEKTSEYQNIMDLLENTEWNFMQIITKPLFGFDKLIDKENNYIAKEKVEYEDIEKLPCSPAVKKGVWQSIKIVEEIVKIRKGNPKHIFIELAREDAKKERTISRKESLRKTYENLKLDNTKVLLEELKMYENELDNQRLYLYFLQNGKCLYSGEALNINELDKYEVDHIIPRSLIKDDSIDNLALVKKEENQRKSDGLTLTNKIIDSQKDVWYRLLECKLISTKKYNRLMRRQYKEEDIEGFINRQLVETRQISKHVVDLLNSVYGSQTVVSIKAQLSHDFRKKYDLYKIRELNNFHHAQDAYLASSLGNYIMTRYPKLEPELIYNSFKGYDTNSEENKKGYGYILNIISKDLINDNGEVIINSQEWLNNIIKTMGYQDPIVTKKSEKQTGAFYKQTLYPKNEKLIPIKANLDPKKYGGYTGENDAYFVLIKNNRKIKLVGIPIVVDYMIKDDLEKLKEYILKKENIKEADILKNNIKKYQKIIFRGQECYLVADAEVQNAVELKLNKQDIKTLYIALNDNANKSLEMDLNQELNNLMSNILEKMELHYPLFSYEYLNIKDYFEKGFFSALDVEQKRKFIKEVLKMLKADSGNANLIMFNNAQFTKFTDRMGRKSKVSASDISKSKIIYESITGLYRCESEF